MPQRTIADARQRLEDYTPTLTPEARKAWIAEVATAEKTMTARGVAYVDHLHETHAPRARAVSESLAAVRDDARALADEVKAGRISDADAAARLERLRADARSLRTAGETLTARADEMDAAEADPIAYAEAVANRYPHMRQTFTF